MRFQNLEEKRSAFTVPFECLYQYPCISSKPVNNSLSPLEQNNWVLLSHVGGGAVASRLVHSSPNRAVWVQALAGDIMLCSWSRLLTLTVPLSTQVYDRANLMLGVTMRWTSIPSRGE